MIKRITLLILMFIVVVANTVIAAPKDNVSSSISESEFLAMVHKNQFFNQYKDGLFSDSYHLLNPLKDVNDKQIGWIVQYELDYSNGANLQPDIVNFRSLLTFIYNYETGEINSLVLDYSRLLEKKAIYIVDLSAKRKKWQLMFPITPTLYRFS